MKRPLVSFFITLAIVVGFDQGTKLWARDALAGGMMPVIGDTVSFRLAFNPGMAFSLLADSPGLVRVLLSVIGLGALIGTGFYASRARGSFAAAVAMALIGGGALGNVIDRLTQGVVTDFVALRFGSFRWPTFNVADGALLVGAILLLFARASLPARAAPRPLQQR